MEADSLSASCPQKVFPGHEFSIAIKWQSLTLSIWKKTQFYVSTDYLGWKTGEKKLLYC